MAGVAVSLWSDWSQQRFLTQDQPFFSHLWDRAQGRTPSLLACIVDAHTPWGHAGTTWRPLGANPGLAVLSLGSEGGSLASTGVVAGDCPEGVGT